MRHLTALAEGRGSGPGARPGPPGPRSPHDHPDHCTRRARRGQAHGVRLPSRRRGRRLPQLRPGRDGGPARLLPGAGRARPADRSRARAGDRHRRAVRHRVAQRPGGRRLRDVRRDVGPLHAARGARRRPDRRVQPGVPARLLPDRLRHHHRCPPDLRPGPRRGRPRVGRPQPRRPRGVRALLPAQLCGQPGLELAACAGRRRAQAGARRARARPRLRPRGVDHPDGGGLPGFDVRRLGRARGVDRRGPGARDRGRGRRPHRRSRPRARPRSPGRATTW